MLTATFLFSGFSDYWQGHSGRGIDGGAAFAFYGKDTTLRDLVDQWVEDFYVSGDFEYAPESITQDDIRACILESFSDVGRADYESNAVYEFSQDCEEDDEDCESPIAIMWIEWEKCPDCDNLSGEDTNDGLCTECHELNYGENNGRS